MTAGGPEPGFVVIGRRYRGPPDSANGGYACGLLATRLESVARVTLRQPPPLEVPLALRRPVPACLELVRDDAVIAEAGPGVIGEAVPAAVGWADAGHAAAGYAWATAHPFPGCFVCGPDRRPGDGLRIFPGPVPGRRVVAAPWVPDPTVCGADGLVLPEIVWAALDCPSWFGLLAFGRGVRSGLLGRLTARVLRRPAAAEPCVAMGWAAGRDGRKLYGGAALYAAGGDVLGWSEAVWIEPRDAATPA